MKAKSISVAMLMLLVLAIGVRIALGQAGGTDGQVPQDTKTQSKNALMNQAQDAINAKNWREAISLLQQLITVDPNRWESFQALGNAQLNLGQYEDSVRSYEKGIQLAQKVLSGSVPEELRNPDSDPARAKAGIGQMLTQEGNAYIKLRKYNEAISAYTRAAEISPHPATAYFNLCATYYNAGIFEGAEAACDKAIASDPNKADTYYIKGSIMFGKGKLDANNKYVVPAGTVETLKKYLELSPNGPHANNVKQMLEMIGVK